LLIRIDMQVARKVMAIVQNKHPNHIALEQSEVRAATQEGDEAMANLLPYDDGTAAENYHPFHWFKRTWSQGQKAFEEWHAKQQQQQQEEKANEKCQDRCRVHRYYADCKDCISKIYPGVWQQAYPLRASIPQCHCHMGPGAEFVFSLVPE